MRSIKLRRLTIEDYDQIVGLWRLARLPFKPSGRESRRMIQEQMQSAGELFIGAFHKTRLVGIVLGSYDGRMKGWIGRLAVDPKYRRKGLGQRLVKAVEEALEKRGAGVFSALIDASNEASVNLFRSMGYVVHQNILYVSRRRSEDV